MVPKPSSSVLEPWHTTASTAVLHTDTGLLPRMRAAHASWNYRLPDCAASSGPPTLTYSMRALQGVAGTEHWCVTLNEQGEVPTSAQHYRAEYAHPLYTPDSVATHALLPQLRDDASTTGRSFLPLLLL